MTSSVRSVASRGIPWLVIAGVLVAALSLRGPIVAPTPVLRDIERDLGLGSASVGLLTTAPVLMFALLTPIAAIVIRRSGAERALLLSLSGVLAGTLIRALPGFGWMLTGMLVIGAAITLGNVVIPVIIRRDVPGPRVGMITAAYVATLNAGSLLTSLLTAPLADVVGWSWALVFWGFITVIGLFLWGVHLRRIRASGNLSGERYSGVSSDDSNTGGIDPATVTGPLPVVTKSRSVFRNPTAWLLLATFSCQTTIYYAFSTWLPSITADELGLDRVGAGALASLFQGMGILGAFVVPILGRFAPHWVPASVICVCWLLLTIGMLALPGLTWVWLIFGAIAHSGGFVVIFTVLVAVSRSDREAAGMSAFVQGGGYAVGAVGAPVVGALHEATGGWAAGESLLIVLASLYAFALLAALISASRRGRNPVMKANQ
ncbi:CP family cyanate transporter-like MFS transporter [Microbacterium halimionae]|uniref:CP family cyanate transporter-like MFS transporter n=1 Tax=Microbacterium halimionae TaxID=1526413 RepID=A0A7W3JNY1_9MICO|nr:MFS transporter [Microbacterium halimionae]MBA8816271.1 CP family cyanate transporter-like MFS transporter [Microbacterium halimionae]NII96474.1 CP family cyanate transporter-like MFS transporter [Microbacterium halimionae]